MFGVSAVGEPPLGFAWRRNGTNIFDDGNINGSKTANLSLLNVAETDLGTYDVVITNNFGSVTSSVASLTITLGPATATPTVVNGFVIGATITDGGCGYTNTPTVRIIGGDGSGAQAVAVVSNGKVVAVNVLAAGAGYTNMPIIVIKPPFIPQPTMKPTALTFGPLVTPVVKLQLGSLSPYDSYQLEFKAIAEGTWNNLGTPFIPTATTNTQYVSATGSSGFLRVKYVP